jgi:ATP-dependent Clp protease adapter protein ClpS
MRGLSLAPGEFSLSPWIEYLDWQSKAHGLGEFEPICQDTGVFCYVARRFQSKSLNSKDSDGEGSDESSELYEVRIIDNDYNTYQQVMDVSMLALDVSEDEAFAIAWEVDHQGYCVVAQGPYEAAEAVADIIRFIGIEVQVNLMEARVN